MKGVGVAKSSFSGRSSRESWQNCGERHDRCHKHDAVCGRDLQTTNGACDAVTRLTASMKMHGCSRNWTSDSRQTNLQKNYLDEPPSRST